MSAPPDRPAGSSRRARRSNPSSHPGQRGLSLVELIMFIIIVGIGVAGILLVFSVTTKASADPLIQKQMLAIAEALMEEVQAKPFTYCDPDDPNAATAADASGCTGGAGGANDESNLPLGPEAGETTRATYDNVSDYGPSLTINPIKDITDTTISGLGAYAATIAVAGSTMGGIGTIESLLITVTVSKGGDSLVVQSYRTRYAPNAVP